MKYKRPHRKLNIEKDENKQKRSHDQEKNS